MTVQPYPYPTIEDAHNVRPSIPDTVAKYTYPWGKTYWMQTENKLFADIKDRKYPYQHRNIDCLRTLLGGHAGHIVDIGVNVGMMCVEYSPFADRITGFDASTLMLEMAAKNLVINGVQDKVTLYQQALGDTHRTMYFTQKANNGASSYLSTATPEKRAKTKRKYNSELLKLDVAPLDSYNLTDVDAIKIDVEGAEMMVVEGAAKTIERYLPLVQAELMEATLNMFKTTPQDVVDWFTKRGYVCCNITRENMNGRWYRVKNLSDIFFVHKDKAQHVIDVGGDAFANLHHKSYTPKKKPKQGKMVDLAAIGFDMDGG
jgi:FkbM family methyltransferase